MKAIYILLRGVPILRAMLREELHLAIEFLGFLVQFVPGALERGVVVLRRAKLDHRIAQGFAHTCVGGIGLIRDAMATIEDGGGHSGNNENGEFAKHG
jgi:hypothetical protein